MPRRSVSPRLLLSLLALLLAGGASVSPAADLPDPMDQGLSGKARLEALIERIKVEQNAMKTLTARFVQRRESDLLIEPEESQGVFYYRAPDHVRWEYLAPNPISIILDGKEMTTWYRDLGRADRLKISRYSSQVFKYLGASGSMETLVDYFRVTVRFPEKAGDAYRLRLLPKYERIREKLDSMTLWVDPVHFIPTRLHYVTAEGDTTEYEFLDLRVNGDIPGDRFSLELPAGVVIREVDLGPEAG